MTVITMGRNVLTTVSVFAIFIVIIIIGFFLLDIERIALSFWALGSLIFSLVISVIIMVTFIVPKKNKDGVFYTAGLNTAVWIYEIIVVINVVFTKAFVEHLKGFILLQIVIHALFFTIAIIIIRVSGHIHDSNKTAYENLQNGEYNKPKRGGF